MTFGVTVTVPDQPARADLALSQGATFRAQFTWLVDGVPRAVDGSARAKMAFARRAGRGDVLTSVSSDDGEITFSADRRGLIEVVVPAAKTTLLSLDEVRYDLLVVEGSDVYRVAEGKVTIRRSVTTLEA